METKASNTADLTYAVIDTSILSALELSLGVVVACIPFTIPIWQAIASSEIIKSLTELTGVHSSTIARSTPKNSRPDSQIDGFRSTNRAIIEGPSRIGNDQRFQKSQFHVLDDDDIPLREPPRIASLV